MATGSYSGGGEANSLTAIKTQIAGLADNIYKAEAKTSMLSAPPALIRGFQNAKTGQIPSLSMQGLGDYSEVNGYPNGAITLAWADYTLAYDRARKFNVDVVDMMTEAGQLEMGYVMGEFMRQQAVPEMDALTLASIAQRTISNQGSITSHVGHHIIYSYTPAVATFLTKIIDQLTACQVDSNKEDGFTIFVNSAYRSILEGSTEYTKTRDIAAGVARLDGRISSINGQAVVYVPNALMYAKYDTYDGYTDGETAGGFTPAASGGFSVAAQIVHNDAAMTVVAHQVTKIITPEQNQGADAYSIAFRSYFDTIVPNNKRDGCAAIIVSAES